MAFAPSGQQSYFNLAEKMSKLEYDFWHFHKKNPSVYQLYKRFASELVAAGVTRLSSDAILHRVRWETTIKTQSKDRFKVNNNYTAYYARLYVRDHPQYAKMFERRKLANQREES
jgi:3-methyladenine DNA glycosylase AlkC